MDEKKIEAVKMAETKIGMSTLNAMNKVTAQLIDLVYVLSKVAEGLTKRVTALEKATKPAEPKKPKKS